jgi:hypothetical protein
VLGRGGGGRAMLLVDTSLLIEFEDEMVHGKVGPAHGVLARNRRQAAAKSVITLDEFAEGFFVSRRSAPGPWVIPEARDDVMRVPISIPNGKHWRR